LLGEVTGLESEYRRARVVVCPIEVGTGLKIKGIEALAYGKPTIGTPAAWEGFPHNDPPAYVEVASFSDFGRTCCDLLANNSQQNELAAWARTLAQENYSIDAAGEILNGLLSGRP
jgi:glycosyltransferase involved in cell wall biosynthesis